MNLEFLRKKLIEAHKARPELKKHLEDIWGLANSEIEAGESYEHEIELALGSIDELLEEA